MSKHDSLFKKAEVYERLALFSDRKSFLKALAQNATPVAPSSLDENNPGVAPFMNQAPAGLSAQQKQLLMQAQQLLQGAGVESNAIGNAVVFGRVDMAAITKEISSALMTGKLSPLSNEYKSLQSIQQQLAPSASPAGTSSQQGGSKNTGGYPPINPEDQKAVFQFAVETGNLVPDPEKQKADGALGPETRKGLEGVKNYFAKLYPQNPRMTDQQAITAAKFKGRGQ